LDRKRGLVVAVRHHQGRTWRQRMRRAAPTHGSRRMPGRTASPISDTSRLHVSRVIGAIADDVRAPISRASRRFAETRMSGCSRSRRRGANASQSFENGVTFAVISAIATFVHTDIPAFVIGVISLSNESPLFHLGTRPNGQCVTAEGTPQSSVSTSMA
jgi:hypothetical protein